MAGEDPLIVEFREFDWRLYMTNKHEIDNLYRMGLGGSKPSELFFTVDGSLGRDPNQIIQAAGLCDRLDNPDASSHSARLRSPVIESDKTAGLTPAAIGSSTPDIGTPSGLCCRESAFLY
jgi:hypothetical protein